MPTITGPILDSTGDLANGFLRVRASKPFDIGTGHVTQALAVARVRDGIPQIAGQPWSVPVTPDGVYLELQQDLDGEQMQTFTLTIPDVASMTYGELLFNRGAGAGGAGVYWWDLTGDLPFPPEAIDGDMGYDRITGDVWRNDK